MLEQHFGNNHTVLLNFRKFTANTLYYGKIRLAIRFGETCTHKIWNRMTITANARIVFKQHDIMVVVEFRTVFVRFCKDKKKTVFA